MNSKQKRNERPQIIAWSPTGEQEFDDIPPNTELKVVIGENGKDSYLEYQRDDGSVRRLFSLKSGGSIRIRTER